MNTYEKAARCAHEVNRAYCVALGDDSQAPWEDAPQWQKDSAIAGAKAIADRNVGPRESHEGWLAQKVADGWTYGPVKDPEKKEHPCMVPYDELPAMQRRKDELFGAAVRGALGW